MDKKHYCLLINPTAGKGRALSVYEKIEPTLKKLNIAYRAIITKDVHEARNECRTAISRNEIVVAVGGDGTVRAIASVLHQDHGILALIPAGRGNDLSRMLNIPTDPIAAAEILVNGKITTIDMASVNQHPFLSICSLGFDSKANLVANRTKLISGRAVYIYGGLRTLIFFKPITFNVWIDEKKITHVGYTVAVANSKNYGGGIYLAPQASMQDGLLDVVLVGKIPKWRILKNIPKLFRGEPITDPGFRILRGKTIRIETEPEFTLFADGDAICPPPATIRVLPNALQVLVPSSLDESISAPQQTEDTASREKPPYENL